MRLHLLLTITWVYGDGAAVLANVRLTQLPLCMGNASFLYHKSIHKARGAMVTSDDFFFLWGFCMTINILHHLGSWIWVGGLGQPQSTMRLSSLSRNRTVKQCSVFITPSLGSTTFGLMVKATPFHSGCLFENVCQRNLCDGMRC